MTAGWPFSWAAMDSIHSKARLVWQEEICSTTYCTFCVSVLSVWCSVITWFPDTITGEKIFWLGEGSFSFTRLKCKQTVHEDNLWKHAQPAFLCKGQLSWRPAATQTCSVNVPVNYKTSVTFSKARQRHLWGGNKGSSVPSHRLLGMPHRA